MGRKRHRMVKRRKTLGLSQEGLAEAMAVETSTVARWERGETTPQPWHRPRLADALKVSVEEVAEMLAEADDPAAIDPPASAAMLQVQGFGPVSGYERLEGQSTVPVHKEPDTNRRDALKLGPALLATALLQPSPAAVEPASIETLAARGTEAWRLRQLADYGALAELLPSLIAQVEVSTQALPDADREQAIRVAVHAYNATSSLLKTVGDYHLGLVAADRAVRLARTLDDPQLIAAALY